VALAALGGGSALVPDERPEKTDTLRVGTSGFLTSDKDGPKEKGAVVTLQLFIKEEAGMDNTIVRQKDWCELADKLAKGELQVGVFQGYEFAWAQAKHPTLKPLAVAVGTSRYPAACVLVRRDNGAKDFAALEGQSLCLPDLGQRHLHLFAEQESRGKCKELKDFFSKVGSRPDVEECLDDVVDGAVQAAVVDHDAVEAYQRRKPGRFDKLKVVAKSVPFPPVVIAYGEKGLDEATVQRFRDGLLSAGNNEKGKVMLTLFRLTAFEEAPQEFGKMLAQTRKAYPPLKAERK